MISPDTKLTVGTSDDSGFPNSPAFTFTTSPAITFNSDSREMLRITNDGYLIVGKGLSKEKATRETAKLLIAAFENEIEVMVHNRVAAIKKRHPSWCCQKCGNNIGWIGRFIVPFLHKCKEDSK